MKNAFVRALSCFVVVSLLLVMIPPFDATVDAAGESDFIWSAYKGQALLQVYVGPGGRVVVPATLGGYTVAYVGYRAFADDPDLVSVAFSTGLLTIDESAFENCTSLQGVTLPSTLTSIDRYAFRNCAALRSIRLGASASMIVDQAFVGCTDLQSIDVDPANTTICSLDGVLFDKAVTALIDYPAGRVGNYTVPSTVQYIRPYSFYDCDGLTGITLNDGLLSVNLRAFSNCDGITMLSIPDTVDFLGEQAFTDCSLVTSLSIGSTLSTLPYGISPFAGCISLTSISVNPSSTGFTSVDGVLFTKDGRELVQYPIGRPGAYTIPADVTRIHEGAFQESRNLTAITFPEQFIDLPTNLFEGCINLASATLPTTRLSLPTYMFSGCVKLDGIVLPSNLMIISQGAFYQCESLSSIDIGQTDYVGDYAFAGCTSLTSMELPNIAYVFDTSFRGCSSLEEFILSPTNPNYQCIDGVIYRSSGTSMYCFPEGRSGTFEFPAGVLGFRGIAGSKKLTSVVLNEGLSRIETGAFQDCALLTSIGIPDSVELVGESPFAGCDSLQTVHIGKNAAVSPSIGEGCPVLTSFDVSAENPYVASLDGVLFLRDMKKLIRFPMGKAGTYSVPASVEKIGASAFADCTGLTGVGMGNGVLELEAGVFSGCTRLAGVTLSSSIGSLPSSTFAYCGSLTELTLPSALYGIGDLAFFFCEKLRSITLPSTVASIGNGAFYGCGAMTSVTIPSAATTVGMECFGACASLTAIDVEAANPNFASVGGVLFNKAKTLLIQYPAARAGAYVVPSSVATIGARAFVDGNGVTSVSIGPGVASIGPDAFSYCHGLSAITVDPANIAYASLDGVLYDKAMTELIQYPAARPGGFTVPSTVLSIGPDSFATSTHLTSVSFPTGLRRIGDLAFDGCSGLTSVRIPASVQSIGDLAFAACFGLQRFGVDASNPGYGSPDGVLFNKSGTRLIQYPNGMQGGYVVPDGTQWIGDAAFMWSLSLTSVEIPASVTSIGDLAFLGCENLATVYYRGHEPQVGLFAFDDLAYDFSSRYLADKVGFTTPEWHGLPASPFVPDPHMVAFDSRGGDTVHSRTSEHGTTISEPGSPTLSGFVFAGWFTSPEEGTQVLFPYSVTGDVVLYAHWVKPTQITTPVFHINKGIGVLSSIPTSTTVDGLLAALNEKGCIRVLKGAVVVAGGTSLGTGMLVQLMDGDTVVQSLTVVITGDVNGDGRISLTDFVQTKAHLMEVTPLTGAYALACDVNGDGRITLTDFVKLKSHLMEIAPIVPQSY